MSQLAISTATTKLHCQEWQWHEKQILSEF